MLISDWSSDVFSSDVFDVNVETVAEDVAAAFFAPPNNTLRFAGVAPTGVTVERGETLDGLGRYLKETIVESDRPAADVAAILKRTETDVVVSYLPVGSERATRWYVEQALEAGCAFVNCIPVFIASREDRSEENTSELQSLMRISY